MNIKLSLGRGKNSPSMRGTRSPYKQMEESDICF